MKILLCKVGCEPEAVEIENTLKAQQDTVDGLIEVVWLADGIFLVVNEEGKINGKCVPNRKIDYKGFCDTLYGDFFITAVDDGGANISMSDDQVQEYTEFLAKYTHMV